MASHGSLLKLGKLKLDNRHPGICLNFPRPRVDRMFAHYPLNKHLQRAKYARSREQREGGVSRSGTRASPLGRGCTAMADTLGSLRQVLEAGWKLGLVFMTVSKMKGLG